MKQKFLRNLFFVVGLNLLIKPFWVFGIDRVVQNTVGAEQYGFYFTLFNLSVLFNIILDFGLTNFNNRTISQNNQLFQKFFPNIFILKFLLFVVYISLTFLVSIVLRYNIDALKLLLILGINQFLLSLILFTRSNISAFQFYAVDSIVSVLDRLLMILLVGFLLISITFSKYLNIYSFAFMQTISYTLTLIFAFSFLLKKLPSFRFRFKKTLVLSIIKNSIPYTILVLLMSFYNRIDAILLERILPNGHMHSGIYAQSFRILDAYSQFSLLFAGLLLPMFSKMLKNKQDVSQLVNFSFVIIILPTIIISISSFFFSSQIITLLYNEYQDYSAKIFRILFLCSLPIASSYIFGTLLTANGSIKQLNWISLFGVILNLLLNLILIPLLEAVGAAISALLTQSLVAVIQIYFVWKILKVKIFKIYIIKVLIFLVLFIATNTLFFFFDLNWFLEFIVILIIGFITALLLRLISIKKTIELLFNRQ